MNFIEDVSAGSRPVIVFGASITGKIVLDLLDMLDVEPACFCDNDAIKQSEKFHGFEVVTFDKLRVDYSDAIVIIAAGRYYREIKEQLSGAGFKYLYRDDDLISCIDFSETPHSKLKNITWHLAKLGRLSEIKHVPAGVLHLPRLNVVVTSRCTLNCEHCSSLMPHYAKQRDIDTSRIIKSLDRIFECVDLIYHVEILGGEPFLNKNLPLVAEHLLKSGKILHIDIITNGTVLPPKRVLQTLKHESVSVVIDDYGKLSKRTSSLSKSLKDLDIDFRVNKHWAWANLGSFDSRNLSKQQLVQAFETCNFNSCTELLDGKLHRCPRSSHGTNLGLVPHYPGDYLDVLDVAISSRKLKSMIQKFFYDKPFIQACDHCDGNTRDTLTLVPAVQVPRKFAVSNP